MGAVSNYLLFNEVMKTKTRKKITHSKARLESKATDVVSETLLN